MIQKYLMKSQSFEGTVTFGFDAEGILKFYDNESEMNKDQSAWLLRNFPFSLEHLKEVQSKIKGKLEEIPADLSFDAFWDKYKKKVNRKRCEPLWRKMSESERMLCLMSIESYKNYLKRSGRAILDPENYLKRNSWETNWNQITS